MKNLFACAALSALLMLAGCAGVYRGVNEEGSLVSSSRPELTVRPAENFTPQLAGQTMCMALQKNGFTGTVNTQVWYGLSVREDAQLAVVLAECPDGWTWSIGADSSDLIHYPVLLEMRGVAHSEPDFLVFVRSAPSDPWNRLLGENALKEEIMVARTEWLSSSGREKLIVEYREPAVMPVDDLLAKKQEISAFAGRAKAAFILEKAAPSGKQKLVQRKGGILSDAILAPVLGAVAPAFDYMDF